MPACPGLPVGKATPERSTTITNGQYNGQPLSCEQPAPTPSASSSPTPKPSASTSHAPYPTGGVQTGGGKSGTTNWLPFGLLLAALGAVALAGGGTLALRRYQGR